MRVYLARHGETDWNVAGRYQGRRESSLTALGARQARALGDALGDRVERVVASPLVRCTATAAPAAARAAVAVETDAALLEIAHGTWEGRLRDEIARNDPERYRLWRADPAHVAFEAGESLADVRTRWRAFAAAPRPGVATLAVTHDAVVRVALLEATGRDLSAFWSVRVENGAYAVFEVHGNVWNLIEECVADHLAGLRATLESQAL